MGYMKRMAENRRQSYRRGRVQAMSELELFRKQWTQNMVRYWQERIDKLRINGQSHFYFLFLDALRAA